jgi:hypothetical protein
MTMRLPTSLLALTLVSMPMGAQTARSSGTPDSNATMPKAPQKAKVVAREASVSAQDATAQSNINKADIQDLKKRVAALETEVKALQASSKK